MKHKYCEEIYDFVRHRVNAEILHIYATCEAEGIIDRTSGAVTKLAENQADIRRLKYFQASGLVDYSEIAFVSMLVFRRYVRNEPIFLDDLIGEAVARVTAKTATKEPAKAPAVKWTKDTSNWSDYYLSSGSYGWTICNHTGTWIYNQ